MNDASLAAVPLTGPDDVHPANFILDRSVRSYRQQVSDGYGLASHASLEFTLGEAKKDDRIIVIVVEFTDEGQKTFGMVLDLNDTRMTVTIPLSNLARFQAVLHEFKTWSLQIKGNPGDDGLSKVTLSGQPA